MKVSLVHPDIVYHALSSKPGRSERRNALKRLHEICSRHYQNGSNDFSVPTIGKECESQGILKARALYNASSADYKALIDAWSVFGANNIRDTKSEESAVKSQSEAPKNRNNYVSRIADPVIRAHVLSLIEDRDRLRVMLNLVEAEKHLRDLEVGKQAAFEVTAAKLPRGRPLKNVSEWTLKPGDLTAFKKAISPEFMKSQGWRLGPQGEIRNSIGETLYEPGYLQGIKKVLANGKEVGSSVRGAREKSKLRE